jgi:putative FmdB family regulatory protein
LDFASPEGHVPTYQYACKACDHRFEAVQSFTDTALTECPACSGGLRKVFSSVGVVFKGSGFYRTDSRAGAGSTMANGESKGESGKGEPATSDSSKSESKTSESSGSSKGSSAGSSSTSSTPAAAAS